MKPWQRNGLVAVAVLAFGAARMPFEAAVTRDLRQAHLLSPPLEIGALDKIDQTGWAVALGGLRTLVATFLNLRAFGYFEESKWDALADTYNTIVALAPNSTYYWENGAWHIGTNAASYYINDSELPALRRREAWRTSVLRGRAFLERGIRNNPDNWSLLKSLGDMLSDDFKYPAFGDPNETFTEAAEAYGRAVATGRALGYVERAEALVLARVNGREADALKMLHKLYENPRNRVPTLMVMILVLESYENPAMDTASRAIELFGTPQAAYDALRNHWRKVRGRYPNYGVAGALESLEKTLSVPAAESVFQGPLPPPAGPNDWFKD